MTSRSPHHSIASLHVSGGFLAGAKLDFADGLNCVIGPRGTGKTTVVELLRFLLQPSEASARNKQVQANLKNGVVRASLRTKYGVTYNAERGWNATCRVSDEGGGALSASLDQLFAADHYSQNEIEAIAVDRSSQLALLDRFATEEIRALEASIAVVERDLAQNAAEIIRLRTNERDLDADASEAPGIEEKLKGMQAAAGPDAALINAAHADKTTRERETKAFEVARQKLRSVRTEAQSMTTTAARKLTSVIDEQLLTGRNRDAMGSVARHLGGAASELETAMARVAAVCDATEEALAKEERALAGLHVRQDAEYRQIVEKSNEDSARATERAKLQTRLADAKLSKTQLDVCRTERREAETRRRELVAKLSHLRDSRFATRVSIARDLTERLAPTIRVSIAQNGDSSRYAELLTEALKGTAMKFSEVVRRVVESIGPEELVAVVRRNDLARLTSDASLDEVRARKLVERLQESDTLYAIEVVELADVPKIELRHGADYKDSAEVSTGQRCTSILPILLLESERPLIIDQPEDNLDGEFIFATVVGSILKAKASRQLIFVTHNPNIPVLGEAERVFVLASDGRSGTIERAGTVDEVKDAIERILEGGREAFERRKQRYGH